MKTTSCSSATSAAAAIFQVWKYSVSTTVTRSRKTPRAMRARLVTLSPQDGPTRELVTAPTGTPNSSASSPRRASASGEVISPVCTRTVSSPIRVTAVVPPSAGAWTTSWARLS